MASAWLTHPGPVEFPLRDQDPYTTRPRSEANSRAISRSSAPMSSRSGVPSDSPFATVSVRHRLRPERTRCRSGTLDEGYVRVRDLAIGAREAERDRYRGALENIKGEPLYAGHAIEYYDDIHNIIYAALAGEEAQ